MADDIVTRLRGTYCSCDVPHHEHTCPMRQAADEIERLRTALAIAAGMLSTYVVVGDSHPETMLRNLLAEADKAIAKEAHRG